MSINYRARAKARRIKKRKLTKYTIKPKTLLVMKRVYRASSCTKRASTGFNYFILNSRGQLIKIPKAKLKNYDTYSRKTIPDGGFLQLKQGNNLYYFQIISATPKKMTKTNWLTKQEQVRSTSRRRSRSTSRHRK